MGYPYIWVAIIALVFLDIAFSISLMSIFQVLISQSIATGLAPTLITANKLDIIVKFGIITSSFFFRFKHFNEISRAAVPLETVAANFFPIYF